MYWIHLLFCHFVYLIYLPFNLISILCKIQIFQKAFIKKSLPFPSYFHSLSLNLQGPLLWRFSYILYLFTPFTCGWSLAQLSEASHCVKSQHTAGPSQNDSAWPDACYPWTCHCFQRGFLSARVLWLPQ